MHQFLFEEGLVVVSDLCAVRFKLESGSGYWCGFWTRAMCRLHSFALPKPRYAPPALPTQTEDILSPDLPLLAAKHQRFTSIYAGTLVEPVSQIIWSWTVAKSLKIIEHLSSIGDFSRWQSNTQSKSMPRSCRFEKQHPAFSIQLTTKHSAWMGEIFR